MKYPQKTSKHLRGFRPRPLLGSATGHWPWLAHRPAAQCYTSFLVTHPRWTSRRRVNRLTTRRGNAFLPGVRVELSRKTRSPKSFKIGGPRPPFALADPELVRPMSAELVKDTYSSFPVRTQAVPNSRSLIKSHIESEQVFHLKSHFARQTIEAFCFRRLLSVPC